MKSNQFTIEILQILVKEKKISEGVVRRILERKKNYGSSNLLSDK